MVLSIEEKTKADLPKDRRRRRSNELVSKNALFDFSRRSPRPLATIIVVADYSTQPLSALSCFFALYILLSPFRRVL